MSYNRDMDEMYRLIYRGEVLQGQHPSVVKKRLANSLNLDEAHSEQLFTGKAVVLKRKADTKTAARLQALFKKAGARLRVMPVETDDNTSDTREAAEPEMAATDARPVASIKPTQIPPPDSMAAFDVLPAGSDVLTTSERQVDQISEVNTDHLSVQDAGGDLGVPSDPDTIDARSVPEISHLSVADVGTDLHETDEMHRSTDILVPVIDFDLAEVGSDILPKRPGEELPLEKEIDIEGLDLAEVGADIDQSDIDTPPAAPDTSHLNLNAD